MSRTDSAAVPIPSGAAAPSAAIADLEGTPLGVGLVGLGFMGFGLRLICRGSLTLEGFKDGVKVLRQRGDVLVLRLAVEPGEMRQQQPRVVAPPRRDHLAVIIDLFLDPVQGPAGQHVLGLLPRDHQGRVPTLRKDPAGPPHPIDRLVRHAEARDRHTHLPAIGKPPQEGSLNRTSEPRLGGPRGVARKGFDGRRKRLRR